MPFSASPLNPRQKALLGLEHSRVKDRLSAWYPFFRYVPTLNWVPFGCQLSLYLFTMLGEFDLIRGAELGAGVLK